MKCDSCGRDLILTHNDVLTSCPFCKKNLCIEKIIKQIVQRHGDDVLFGNSCDSYQLRFSALLADAMRNARKSEQDKIRSALKMEIPYKLCHLKALENHNRIHEMRNIATQLTVSIETAYELVNYFADAFEFDQIDLPVETEQAIGATSDCFNEQNKTKQAVEATSSAFNKQNKNTICINNTTINNINSNNTNVNANKKRSKKKYLQALIALIFASGLGWRYFATNGAPTSVNGSDFATSLIHTGISTAQYYAKDNALRKNITARKNAPAYEAHLTNLESNLDDLLNQYHDSLRQLREFDTALVDYAIKKYCDEDLANRSNLPEQAQSACAKFKQHYADGILDRTKLESDLDSL